MKTQVSGKTKTERRNRKYTSLKRKEFIFTWHEIREINCRKCMQFHQNDVYTYLCKKLNI
jgi:hypothetical protein